MKVRKNKLKILKDPDWKAVRNPDDCQFGTFKIVNSSIYEYMTGIDKDTGNRVMIAKKRIEQ